MNATCASDKPSRVEDDFGNMPPLEDASDNESRQGLSPHTLDFPDQGMLPAIMQAKGLLRLLIMCRSLLL